MSALAILTWIKNNWFPLALCVLIVAVLSGTFYEGYHLGGTLQLAKDQKEIQGIRDAAQQAQDKLQASADQKGREYEAARTEAQGKLSAAQKELTHEQTLNHAFATCHAGPDFVRLYAGIAAANPKGDAPGVSHGPMQ